MATIKLKVSILTKVHYSLAPWYVDLLGIILFEIISVTINMATITKVQCTSARWYGEVTLESFCLRLNPYGDYKCIHYNIYVVLQCGMWKDPGNLSV